MTVLHLSAGRLYGGVETVLTQLAAHRALCPEMEPHFAFCFEGRAAEALRAAGAPVHVLGEVRARNPLSIAAARRRLRDILPRFDAVVNHLPWAHAIFGGPARRSRARLALWLHGPFEGKHWTERAARRIEPDVVLCCSRFVRDTAAKAFRGSRVEAFYHALDFGPSPAPASDDGPPVVVQVSRMESWKGHRVLLEALAKLRADANWRCRIIGGAQSPAEERYLDSLRALAARLEISSRVEFLGHRTDVAAQLSRAAIFCQPNLEPEPFGVVFVEALHAGVPVVTSAIGGGAEIVDSTCGRLAPAGDAEALAVALRELLADDGLRRRLGAAGPARARALCDPARQLRMLHALLAGTAAGEAA